MDTERSGLPVRKRPPRLACFDYVGPCRYFLTLCTAGKRQVFVKGFDYEFFVTALSRLAGCFGIDVLTYCFMPDHLHILLEGNEDTDLKEFVRVFKQMTSYHRGNKKGSLWQRSYYDRILRRDEDTFTVARYILNNPVRRGLAEDGTDYPYSGSFVVPITEIF
jgi:putative transposase